MKRTNKILNILVIAVISFTAIVGIAGASGIFYFNAVRNQIVFNANISMTGTSLSRFVVNTINSERSPLSISGLQDLQFRFGKLLATSSFGLNNNANSRVFQIGNDGTLLMGSGLSTGTLLNAANVKFSVNAAGNLTSKGGSQFKGGFIPNGNLINSTKINESIKLNGDNAMIHVPARKLGFGVSSDAFYYANYIGTPFYALSLSRAGELSVPVSISSSNFCLTGDKCIANWSEAVDVSTFADTTYVGNAIKARTKAFGGMYSFRINIPTSGVNYVNENLRFIDDPYPSGYSYSTIPNGSCLNGGNPVDTISGIPCSCPSGYTNTQVFQRTISDNSMSNGQVATYRESCSKTYDLDADIDIVISCPRDYFFMCTKLTP